MVAETRLFAGDMIEVDGCLSGRPQSALIILSGLLKKLGGRFRKTSGAVPTLVRAP